MALTLPSAKTYGQLLQTLRVRCGQHATNGIHFLTVMRDKASTDALLDNDCVVLVCDGTNWYQCAVISNN